MMRLLFCISKPHLHNCTFQLHPNSKVAAMESEDDDGGESQEQQEDDKSTTNNITDATKDDCAEESLLIADDSDDGTLLPCEFCLELFPILSIEEHQEYCRISPENQELSTSGTTSPSTGTTSPSTSKQFNNTPSPGEDSTSSPVDHSTSTSSPVDQSTSTDSPIDQSTSTDSPIDQSTSSDSPVDQSTSASSPVDHSTSTNSDISNCSLPVDSSSVAMDTGNRYNGMVYSWNVTPNATQRNSVDSVCAQLGTLQLSSPQQRSSKDQILMSMGGYGQCRHCKVKLLTCSVKYHEKICPVALNANPGYLLQRMDGYQRCQYCQGTFLSRSVQYHQRICPAKPLATAVPLNQPSSYATSNVTVQAPTTGSFVRCQYCNANLLPSNVKYHERLCPKNFTISQTTSSPSFAVSRTSPLAPRPGPPSPYNTPPAPVTSTRTASSIPPTAANIPYNIYSNGSVPRVQNNHHFPPSFHNGTNTHTSVPNPPTVISSNYPTVPIATAIPPSFAQPLPTTSSPSRPRPAATAFNGSPTLNINIVTWNIEKGTSRGSTAGFTEMRRFLLSQYSNRQPETFFCLQEIKMSSPFTFSSTLYSEQPGGKTDKEAGIGCPFHIKNCNVTVHQPPPQGSTCRYNNTANCRFYGTIVRIEDRINRVLHQFLLVSYHGKYNRMSSENRKKEISAFFKQMCTVADIHKMTVIIGGDFNLRVEEWRALVIGENRGRRIEVAANYEMGPRRRGSDLLDTFAVVYPQGGIGCTVCTIGTPAAVDLEGVLQERLRTVTDRDTILQERRVFNIMDHDPVCMSVTLSTPQ